MHRLLHAVLEARVGASPNSIQQLRSGHYLAGTVREQLEHEQRPALELQVARSETCLATGGVDVQPASHDR